MEQTPGSERDTHFFVGDLRLPDMISLWFGLVFGRSTRRLPIHSNFFVDVRGLPLMLQPMVQLVLHIVFQEALLRALPFVLLQVLQ